MHFKIWSISFLTTINTFTGWKSTGTGVKSITDEEPDLVPGVAEDVDGLLVRGAKKRLAVNLNNSLTDLKLKIVVFVDENLTTPLALIQFLTSNLISFENQFGAHSFRSG